jgi:ribonuclease BN (tRNA processing enzyme)
MGEVSVQFLGSGDAFGNRGRFQSCIHVWSGTTRFRIDCGASSLIAMKRLGPHLSLIDTVLLTHLTATTLGLPFLIMEAQYVSRWEKPLVVTGPRGWRTG